MTTRWFLPAPPSLPPEPHPERVTREPTNRHRYGHPAIGDTEEGGGAVELSVVESAGPRDATGRVPVAAGAEPPPPPPLSLRQPSLELCRPCDRDRGQRLTPSPRGLASLPTRAGWGMGKERGADTPLIQTAPPPPPPRSLFGGGGARPRPQRSLPGGLLAAALCHIYPDVDGVDGGMQPDERDSPMIRSRRGRSEGGRTPGPPLGAAKREGGPRVLLPAPPPSLRLAGGRHFRPRSLSGRCGGRRTLGHATPGRPSAGPPACPLVCPPVTLRGRDHAGGVLVRRWPCGRALPPGRPSPLRPPTTLSPVTPSRFPSRLRTRSDKEAAETAPGRTVHKSATHRHDHAVQPAPPPPPDSSGAAPCCGRHLGRHCWHHLPRLALTPRFCSFEAAIWTPSGRHRHPPLRAPPRPPRFRLRLGTGPCSPPAFSLTWP